MVCYNEATAKNCSSLALDVKLCGEYGFTCLEPRIDMLCAYLREHSLEELYKLFADGGVKAQAINAVYLYSDFLGRQDDPGKASRLFSEFIFACQTAKMLKAPGIVVVPPMNSEDSDEPYNATDAQVLELVTPMLRIFSDIAAGFSLSVGLEPVGAARCSVRTVRQAMEILAEVRRDNCKIVLDAFNLYLNDQNTDFAEIRGLNKEDILIAHINDCEEGAIPPLRQRMRTLCGSGVINIGGFLSALRSIGYDGAVSIETFRPEYWELEPRELIERAYETTIKALQRAVN